MINSIEKAKGKEKKPAGPGGSGVPKKPLVLLGIGNAKIEEWIRFFFIEQANIEVSSPDPGELRERLALLSPDILVLMRQNSMGGIPDAGSLASGAAPFVPRVLFIVGELDEEGREMFTQARDSGVNHIITCEKGGQIYGDELVYTLTGMIREIKSPGGNKDVEEPDKDILGGEAGKTLDSLFRSAGNIGRAIIKSAGNVSGRAGAKINRSAGISINDAGGHPANPSGSGPTAVVPGGLLAVVTPWRPGQAGRMAAGAVKLLAEVNGAEVTYIGACKNSTGALWLDVAEDELLMSDWRVPGSNCPIIQENIKIFAVDPVKNLQPEDEEDFWAVVKKARKTSTYTVVDLAGNMAMAHRAARQGRSVLLVVVPGNDPVELKVSAVWLKNLMDGNGNIVVGIDVRGVVPEIPRDLNPRLVVRNNPADALSMALKKQNDNVFVWV